MGATGPITHLGYTYQYAYVRIVPRFSGIQGSKSEGLLNVIVEMYPNIQTCQAGNKPLMPRWLEVVFVDTDNKVRPDRVRDDGVRTYFCASDIMRLWGGTPPNPHISAQTWEGLEFYQQVYALLALLPQWENLVEA